jgi:hypothetical protein
MVVDDARRREGERVNSPLLFVSFPVDVRIADATSSRTGLRVLCHVTDAAFRVSRTRLLRQKEVPDSPKIALAVLTVASCLVVLISAAFELINGRDDK